MIEFNQPGPSIAHVTKQEAISLRLSMYYEGKECENGHKAYRRIYDDACSECNIKHLPTPVSRAQAVRLGMNRYFTGERCVHGHLSERYVRNHRCVECNRESRRNA